MMYWASAGVVGVSGVAVGVVPGTGVVAGVGVAVGCPDTGVGNDASLDTWLWKDMSCTLLK
jgi:hypothetical protein